MNERVTITAALTLQGFIPSELVTEISDHARDIFVRHGAAAFESPRETAAVHEAGHAIVATHEGFMVRRIEIYSQGKRWGGRCVETIGWRSDDNTSAEDDLRRARVIVAGLAAEVITGRDNPGSSLDEEALSKVITHNAALKLAPGLESYETYTPNLWHWQVWRPALLILHTNWELFTQLANHLNLNQHKGQIKNEQLRAVLSKVNKVTFSTECPK